MRLSAPTDLAESRLPPGAVVAPETPGEESKDRPPLEGACEIDATEIAALRKAIQEKSLPALAFHFLDYTLRSQEVLFEQINSRKALGRISLAMTIMGVCLIGFYGATMGLHNGWKQGASSGVKLPLLFLLTATICIPSLYEFNVLLGQRFRFMQTVALFSVAIGTTSILLGSMAPVSMFFTLTGASYPFLKLMHVASLGLCGVCGVRYLYGGCKYVARRDGKPLQTRLIVVWILPYSVVGMQLGWRLRPFVGALDRPFSFFRSVEGNFYVAVIQSLRDLQSKAIAQFPD